MDIRSGFVITTHGNEHRHVYECIARVQRSVPSATIFVYVNVGQGKNLEIHKAFPGVRVKYLKDQSGGLTYTWNEGIWRCLRAGIHVIVLLNHDAFVNTSVNDLILAAANAKYPGIYGPTCNPEGAPQDPHHWGYIAHVDAKKPLSVTRHQRWHGLNGFCLAFHARTLLSNMFDDAHFFDPGNPFGGNETEFGKRWYNKGGQCGIVETAYVEHDKQGAWRNIDHALRKVKVHPPPKNQAVPKPLPPPKSLRVAVLAFWKSASVKQLYKEVPIVESDRGVHYSLMLSTGGAAEECTKKLLHGWKVENRGVRRWSNRLRMKHLLTWAHRAVASGDFDYLSVLPAPRVNTHDQTMYISSLAPVEGRVKFDWAAPLDAEAGTLATAMDNMSYMNSVGMSRFKRPRLTHPMYSVNQLVIKATIQNVKLLERLMALGKYVDWHFGFLLSWMAAVQNFPVQTIPRQWTIKTEA